MGVASEMDEAALLRRARGLDRAALAEIYDRLSPGLYRYAMRLLEDATLAEECVGEAFRRLLAALEAGGTLRPNLRAYLYRMVHNWAIDHYRRQPTSPGPSEPDMHRARAMNAEAVHRMQGERVRIALRQLTPEQREVVVLRFLEGWTNQDIAVALGKAEEAVRALLHRALAALREELEGEG